ncbi:MAG: SpoIIE family protein phosphatase [Pseudonocardia sp.]|nr:SpoIIE family protein phosphatase [Pseudonocardia sp.]
MPTGLVHALGRLPFPLAVTTGPDHTVALLTPAVRLLLPALVVGRPAGETAPAALRTALDDAPRTGEPSRVALSTSVTVGCLPVVGADGTVEGVVLHVEPRVAGRVDERGSALQRLAEQLSRAATPEAIGRLAVTAGADVLGADAAGIYAFAGPAELRVLHARGWSDEVSRRFERVTLQRGRPLSDAVLDGVPVYLEDAEQWLLRYPEMAPVGTSEGFAATACLPLRVEDRDLGAAVFTFTAARAFPAGERDHLQAVAALCAQALDRVRLLGAERAARAAAEEQLRRMTFLAETGRLMEAPLSVEQRLQQLADLAVSGVADWCAVHLVREASPGRAADVEQVAVAHTDPEKVAFVARLEEQYPPDPDADTGAIHVSRTGEAVHIPEIPDELLVAAAVDEVHLELIRSIGMRSAVVVPLLVRGRCLGALTLVHAESGRRFSDADLAFSRQLAATAAVALDNARLYEQQRRVARTLQSALLPARLPTIPGVGLAARYQPQNADLSDVYVGGDLYDVVEGPAGAWAVTVGDVCGKGAEAAALTALIRHTVRAEVGHGLGPTEVLRRLNRAMLRDPGPEPARFATVAHALLGVDAAGVTVRLVNAGHVPPLVLRGARVETVGVPGTLLGVYPDVELTEAEIRLERGEVLVLYTDGVTEARGVNGFYGTERLESVLASCAGLPAESVADALLADVTGFQQGRMRDDVAILVVGVDA